MMPDKWPIPRTEKRFDELADGNFFALLFSGAARGIFKIKDSIYLKIWDL